MKLIICLFLVFIFGALAEDDETRRANTVKWGRECMDELQVSPEDMDKLTTKEELNDPKLKKVAFCLMKKAGMMTEDGDLNLEAIKEKIRERFSNEETVNEVVKDCVVKKNTPEETADYIRSCGNRHILPLR